MLLASETLVYGVQPARLVAAAQQLRGRSEVSPEPVTVVEVRSAFGATSSEAAVLLADLARDGFLVAGNAPGEYLPTPTLAQLALAKLGQGLDRQAAEELLNRVVAAAEAVNAKADPTTATVACIVVFGSYLDPARTRLGDLDLGVALTAPEVKPEAGFRRGEMGFFTEMYAPTARTMARLGLRKPGQISLHELDEVRRMRTPYRVVFGREPSRADAARRKRPRKQQG